jgi:DNA-directed RNA polymerase subunit omega
MVRAHFRGRNRLLLFFTNQTARMEADNVIPFEQPKPVSGFSGVPMKSDLVDQAAEIVPDPQILINMVSKRVQQLNTGRAPLIDTVPSMGAADIALTEIIEGKIKRAEQPIT